ncbi:DNA-binding MarR family transcriptional regulator [Inquilinus ginsengisoli]|uniref:hypothetical protein n=1 Tax=Inquilinus ginsengisoli TaxID=363840 RepID=UPI003D25B47B
MSDGLSKALRFIRELQKLDPSLSIACVHTLLVAAKHEGRTISYIVKQSSVSKSTVCRYILDLGETRVLKRVGGNAAAGLGLLLTRDAYDDRREKDVFLTARGKALVALIEEIMGRP